MRLAHQRPLSHAAQQLCMAHKQVANFENSIGVIFRNFGPKFVAVG